MKIKLLILILLVLCGNALFGQVGYNEEVQLSTVSGSNRSSKIRMASDNGFLLSWINEEKYLITQIYNNDLIPIGNNIEIEFDLNTTLDYDVNILPNGNMVFLLSNNKSLILYLYNNDAGLIVEKKIVEEGGSFPAIAPFDDNKFLLLWTQQIQNETGTDIFGTIYNKDGSIYKEQFRINSYTTGTQKMPVATKLCNGNVVVGYLNTSIPNLNYGVFKLHFHIINLKGEFIGQEQVFIKSGYNKPDIVPLQDNKFVICWEGDNTCVQKFTESAVSIGETYKTNINNGNRQGLPKISALNKNNFFLIWKASEDYSTANDGDDTGISGEFVTSELKPKFPEFVINDYSIGNQYEPDCEALSDGKVLITWTSRGKIFGKYYLPKEQDHELKETNLISPAYDATLTTTTPSFEWNQAIEDRVNFPWEVYYDLYISKDENFTDPFVVYSITDTSYYLKEQLDKEQIYYWKVLANTYYGDSLWSSQANGFYISGDAVTDIENKEITTTEFSLSQNFPNPFNPSTMINYQLPVNNDVKLEVYNNLGKNVATLVDENQQAGNYSVNFDATGLSSGIYFYRLVVGSEYVDTRKMIFCK